MPTRQQFFDSVTILFRKAEVLQHLNVQRTGFRRSIFHVSQQETATGYHAMLSRRIWRHGGDVEHRIHYTTGQGRDFQTDSGTAPARRYRGETSEEQGTAQSPTPQDVRCRSEENCCCSAGTMGEDQSREEIGRESTFRLRCVSARI